MTMNYDCVLYDTAEAFEALADNIEQSVEEILLGLGYSEEDVRIDEFEDDLQVFMRSLRIEIERFKRLDREKNL